jgi:hypothetical protein
MTDKDWERFFVKIKKTKSCWIWTACRFADGYGMFQWKRTQHAHRLMWMRENGPIPKGMHICHTCDNPPCVNPKHLFLGTPGDNVRDMVRKGRSPDRRGERHPNAKLSNKDVVEIREARGTFKSIGKRYGVTRQMIALIKKRKSWSHV